MVSFLHELIKHVISWYSFRTAVITNVTTKWFLSFMNWFNMFFQKIKRYLSIISWVFVNLFFYNGLTNFPTSISGSRMKWIVSKLCTMSLIGKLSWINSYVKIHTLYFCKQYISIHRVSWIEYSLNGIQATIISSFMWYLISLRTADAIYLAEIVS